MAGAQTVVATPLPMSHRHRRPLSVTQSYPSPVTVLSLPSMLSLVALTSGSDKETHKKREVTFLLPFCR